MKYKDREVVIENGCVLDRRTKKVLFQSAVVNGAQENAYERPPTKENFLKAEEGPYRYRFYGFSPLGALHAPHAVQVTCRALDADGNPIRHVNDGLRFFNLDEFKA